jgi:hypothetical protein
MVQTGTLSPLRKLDHLHLDHHPSNGQRFSVSSDRPKDDVGLPLTPKHAEPSGCKPPCLSYEVILVPHCSFCCKFTCHVTKIGFQCFVTLLMFCSRRLYERKIIQYTNWWWSLASFLTKEFGLNLLLRWYGILLSLITLVSGWLTGRIDYLSLPIADWWSTHFFSWNWTAYMSRGKIPSLINYYVLIWD